jgi:hypothetical protein
MTLLIELTIPPIVGKEISPGIFAITEPAWNDEFKQWRCLADVAGYLCLISLRITRHET